MKHLFIINPQAGKGKTLKYIPEIKRVFEKTGEDYFIEITKRPGHATEIAREYSQRYICRIYSVGGDGTLNEVLNGMIGSSCSLAVIPSGSGNDFIKSLCKGLSLDNIIQRTVNGNEILSDLGRVNSKYFLNIASIGLDAEVAYNTIRFKRLPGVTGSLAYIMGLMTTLFNYRNSYLEIYIDSKSIKTTALLIAIANGKYYGGGILPAPEARLDDGVFDICLVKGMPRHKILRLLPKYIKGKHEGIKEVSFYKGKHIKIVSSTDIALNADGEVERAKEAIFEIIPQGIKIVVPEVL